MRVLLGGHLALGAGLGSESSFWVKSNILLMLRSEAMGLAGWLGGQVSRIIAGSDKEGGDGDSKMMRGNVLTRSSADR